MHGTRSLRHNPHSGSSCVRMRARSLVSLAQRIRAASVGPRSSTCLASSERNRVHLSSTPISVSSLIATRQNRDKAIPLVLRAEGLSSSRARCPTSTRTPGTKMISLQSPKKRDNCSGLTLKCLRQSKRFSSMGWPWSLQKRYRRRSSKGPVSRITPEITGGFFSPRLEGSGGDVILFAEAGSCPIKLVNQDLVAFHQIVDRFV